MYGISISATAKHIDTLINANNIQLDNQTTIYCQY